MRPLNGANAELTGRVSHAAARGVMATVSAGNYTLSCCILAGLVGEQSPVTIGGDALTHHGTDSQGYPPGPSQAPSTVAPPRLRVLGTVPETCCATHSHTTGHGLALTFTSPEPGDLPSMPAHGAMHNACPFHSL